MCFGRGYGRVGVMYNPEWYTLSNKYWTHHDQYEINAWRPGWQETDDSDILGAQVREIKKVHKWTVRLVTKTWEWVKTTLGSSKDRRWFREKVDVALKQYGESKYLRYLLRNNSEKIRASIERMKKMLWSYAEVWSVRDTVWDDRMPWIEFQKWNEKYKVYFDGMDGSGFITYSLFSVNFGETILNKSSKSEINQLLSETHWVWFYSGTIQVWDVDWWPPSSTVLSLWKWPDSIIGSIIRIRWIWERLSELIYGLSVTLDEWSWTINISKIPDTESTDDEFIFTLEQEIGEIFRAIREDSDLLIGLNNDERNYFFALLASIIERGILYHKDSLSNNPVPYERLAWSEEIIPLIEKYIELRERYVDETANWYGYFREDENGKRQNILDTDNFILRIAKWIEPVLRSIELVKKIEGIISEEEWKQQKVRSIIDPNMMYAQPSQSDIEFMKSNQWRKMVIHEVE